MEGGGSPNNYLQLTVEFCGILLSLMSTQSLLLTSLSSAKLFRKQFMAKPLLQKLLFKVEQRGCPLNVLSTAYLKVIITQGHR